MKIKKYVEVVAFFCENGLFPTELIWEDGTRYRIDCAYDLRPAHSLHTGGQGDRYTIQINGKERYLYFEHSTDRYDPALGRWFVEQTVNGMQ